MDGGIVKIVVFIAVSVVMLYLSRGALRVATSHGFYRIFAWEAILALMLVNSGAWFTDPYSALQIVSWIFLCTSLAMLIPGTYLLMAAGKPTRSRSDDTLMSFEKTSALVTHGIYRYIRHPLYGSLLFLAWGAFLKDITVISICLTAIATVFLTATAKADEAECIRYFGPSYAVYMERSKMFVPFIL